MDYYVKVIDMWYNQIVADTSKKDINTTPNAKYTLKEYIEFQYNKNRITEEIKNKYIELINNI